VSGVSRRSASKNHWLDHLIIPPPSLIPLSSLAPDQSKARALAIDATRRAPYATYFRAAPPIDRPESLRLLSAPPDLRPPPSSPPPPSPASLASRRSTSPGCAFHTSDDIGVELKGVRSGVERRRGVSGLKPWRGRRDATAKVLKDRLSHRRRGRTGTGVKRERTPPPPPPPMTDFPLPPPRSCFRDRRVPSPTPPRAPSAEARRVGPAANVPRPPPPSRSLFPSSAAAALAAASRFSRTAFAAQLVALAVFASLFAIFSSRSAFRTASNDSCPGGVEFKGVSWR